MKAQSAVEYLRSLPPDEPVFVLRAQDVLAHETVEFWASQAEATGEVRSGKIAGARDCAAEMAAWPIKKLPD